MLVTLKDSKQKKFEEGPLRCGWCQFLRCSKSCHGSLLILSFVCRFLVHLLFLIDLKKDISLFLDTSAYYRKLTHHEMKVLELNAT